MNTLTTPWVMMNQLQDLKVAVQSHPARRRQVDPRLERSKCKVIMYGILITFFSLQNFLRVMT